MASIRKEISIDAHPEDVWAAVRDFGAPHRRLFPGVLVDAHLEGNARVITFANGAVVRELLVDIDDDARRLAFTATGGRLSHHNAAMQVFADGDGQTRFVWITDVLPDELADYVGGLVERGAAAMKQTLESQFKESAMKDLVARASVTIDAPVAKVWHALTDPEVIKQYMFGTNVVSDWQEGSPIIWQGEWQGRKYEDKGVILSLAPQWMIRYTHFSPLSGVPDLPENYHTVTVELTPEGTQTRVTLTQDHNATEEEREHSEQNWRMMLEGMKQLLEKQAD